MFKRIGFTILMLLGFLVGVSSAVELTCFEDIFTRDKGKPTTVYRSFTAIAGPAILKIYNGAEDDSKKVRSVVISINGIDVVTPDSFNLKVEYIEVEVDLVKGENDLAVRLKSKPGGMIRVVIFQEVEAEAAAFIGSEGGVIQSDTGISLEIPEGSLSSVELITATLVPEEQFGYAADLENNQSLLGVVNFGPDGLVFENPVTATFPLEVYVNPGSVLSLFVFDEIAESFVQTDFNCTVGGDGYTCTGKITHFSDYCTIITNGIPEPWFTNVDSHKRIQQ